MTDPLADVFRARPPATSAPAPGVVVRSDTSGVWCQWEDGDARHPLGPCRGATRRVSRPITGGHDHLIERLPIGTAVLLASTAHGPWVVAHDEEVVL